LPFKNPIRTLIGNSRWGLRMKSQIIFTFAIFFVILLNACHPRPVGELTENSGEKNLTAEIKNCHDGDTCHILTSSGLWFNARLAGIDAPEVGRYGKKADGGQPLGHESRDALLKILQNNPKVTMKQLDLDPYNRPIVEIFVGDECVNIKMLELGMAERYRGKTKRLDTAAYDGAQSKARNLKLGIWGLQNYTSPGSWRKEEKNDKR